MSGLAQSGVDVVVVTGMSGSGKSTAIHALEDRGFYCIDNLPTELLSQFVDLCSSARDRMSNVALGLDLRDPGYVAKWSEVRRQIVDQGHRVFVIFLTAADDELMRRFSETRRRHPLGQRLDLAQAILAEREVLAPLKETADFVLDTTELNVHDLKRAIGEALPDGSDTDAGLTVTVKSFGFKHGAPRDADVVLDVRFIPNPHFVDELRPLTGREKPVADFVLKRAITEEFLDHTEALLTFLLPHYAAEGKAYLTVGIGCTGGRHRSVALAEELARRLQASGMAVQARHRDIDRGG